MKDPVTNWTVSADLPTPPDPRTTTLYSLMVPKTAAAAAAAAGSSPLWAR